VIFLQFSFLVVQSTNKFTGGIYRFISVTVCKGGQISKVFWTVFKYFKNGSFANPEQGLCGNLIQPTISLEMPVPSQGHYGFHSFPVVD
jgi:hypothetical protein